MNPNLIIMKTLLIFTTLFVAVALTARSGVPFPNMQNSDDGVSPPSLFQKPPTTVDTLVKMKNPQISASVTKEKSSKVEEKVTPPEQTLSKTTNDTVSRSDKVHENSKIGSIEYLVRWINLLLKVT